MFDNLKQSIVKILDDKYELRGTGFFVSNEGHIVTCWHVIEELSFIYIDYNGEKCTAQKLDSCCNPGHDIAVLKININTKFQYLNLNKNFDEGEKIYTVGFSKEKLKISPQGFINDGVLILLRQIILVNSLGL